MYCLSDRVGTGRFEYRDRFKHRFRNCSLSQKCIRKKDSWFLLASCSDAHTHTHTHTNSLCWQRQSFNINVPSAGNCFQRSWKAPFIELVKHYPSPSLISPTHTHSISTQHLDLQRNTVCVFFHLRAFVLHLFKLHVGKWQLMESPPPVTSLEWQ